MIGSLVWLRLSDFWGRKWLIVGGGIFHILILFLLLIKMSSTTIYVTLFLVGVGSPLLFSLSYLLLIEIVSPSRRALFNMIMNLADGSTPLLLPLFYQYARNWRILYWINLSLTGVSLLVLVFFAKESPKFYVSIHKFEKAKDVYSHIAKVNRNPKFSTKLEGEKKEES